VRRAAYFVEAHYRAAVTDSFAPVRESRPRTRPARRRRRQRRRLTTCGSLPAVAKYLPVFLTVAALDGIRVTGTTLAEDRADDGGPAAEKVRPGQLLYGSPKPDSENLAICQEIMGQGKPGLGMASIRRRVFIEFEDDIKRRRLGRRLDRAATFIGHAAIIIVVLIVAYDIAGASFEFWVSV